MGELGPIREALADLHISLKKEEKPARLFARGEIFYRLARYPDSLQDFERAEYLKPQHWGGWVPLYMAECHVRLGNGRAALSACAKIPDDYFSPGLYGVARGNKSEIIQDISWRISGSRG